MDVYRADYAAERNILSLALYIAFFPKLIAGPIVRGKDFLPQLEQYRGITCSGLSAGMQIFIFGLFKKTVLADHLGVFVDDVFFAPMAFNTGTVLLAVVSYSLQIYFDFSGYSDMAIGASKMLGFDFAPNFNLPYVSQNTSEFWKRWHISLSSWFQDYLYIPLGGNRRGTGRTYLNIMIVMLVSGLWHGANWTFIAWGGCYGLSICANKAFGKYFRPLGPLLNGIITFCLVSLFWVVFRAPDFSTALAVWTGALTVHTGISQPYAWSFLALCCLLIATFLAFKRSQKINRRDKKGILVINGYYPILDLSKFIGLVIFFTSCGLTLLLGYFGNTAFIYGAF